jgi:hypothetical protein
MAVRPLRRHGVRIPQLSALAARYSGGRLSCLRIRSPPVVLNGSVIVLFSFDHRSKAVLSELSIDIVLNSACMYQLPSRKHDDFVLEPSGCGRRSFHDWMLSL